MDHSPSDPGAPAAAAPRALRRLDTQRIDAQIELDLHSDSNFFAGLSENVSEGGIFIATWQVKRPGEQLVIEFGLPGIDKRLRAVVEVRWVRESRGDGDAHPGFGARFVKISEEDRALVERFVRHRKPLFYE